MITITLPGVPRGKERPRFGRGTTGAKAWAYPAKMTTAYERSLGWAAKTVMVGKPLLAGPLRLQMLAYMPIPLSWGKAMTAAAIEKKIRPTGRPDFDNLLKVVDGLNGVVWTDDAHVVEAFVAKYYGLKPHLVVMVEQIT